MSTLWMEILPGLESTRVRVQSGPDETLLRARLPHAPRDPRAIAMLCEAVALWTGRKVCAALVVEGSGSFCATRAWRNTVDTLTQPPRFEIHFVSAARSVRVRRDRSHDDLEDREELGSYHELRRLILGEVEF